MMLIDFFKRTFRNEPKLHPLDGRLAKQWIKRRLAILYPELRSNPLALERAYQQLGLEPRAGTEEGDAHTYFEMSLPD
jgi:hypothetical protein